MLSTQSKDLEQSLDISEP